MRISHYLGDSTALCFTEFGQKMFVDTRDNSLTPHLLAEGTWEPWITTAIERFFPGSTLIDVGANMGWYSLVAQKYQAKRVIAFEPNPSLFHLLERTKSVNGYSWDLRKAAVSDEEGKAVLHVHPDFAGGGSITDKVGELSHEVDCVTLDKALAGIEWAQGERIVLKLDTEGSEARAVLGAKDLLSQKNCSVFLEYHSDPQDRLRVREMLDFFESQRYSIGHVLTDGRIQAISRADISGVPDVDMLCFQRFVM